MMGNRNVWLLALVGIGIGACGESVEPLAVAPETEPRDRSASVYALLDCTVDLGGEEMSCSSRDPSLPGGASGLILGHQGVNVLLSSDNAGYDETTEIFQVDVTVQNLIGQALGTVDGQTPHADGIRVFYHALPAAVGEGGGTITVLDAETGLFVGSDQPYYQYDEMLATDEVSKAETWRWGVPNSVSEFHFSVAVWAEVQHPDGWVEFASGKAYQILSAGDTANVAATGHDVHGAPVPLSWTSRDPQIASVSEVGTITGGEKLGVAMIVASTEYGAIDSVQVANGVIFVDAAASGSDNGTSWSNAYTNLEDALAAAGNPSEIWVAQGTYSPATKSSSFNMKKGVGIYGGFAGVETIRDERRWWEYTTILSGDINGDDGPDRANRSDNASRIVRAGSSVDSSGVLDGFTLSGAESTTTGGAIRIDNGSPTFRNLIFTDNYAYFGASMYIQGGSPTITNAVFTGNETLHHGPGIRAASGATPVLTNVTIYGNTAGDCGGAIDTNGETTRVTVHNAILWGNTANNSSNQCGDPDQSQIHYHGGGSGIVSHTIVQHGCPKDTTCASARDDDPLFVDGPGGILTLLAGSPAIDAGDNGLFPASAGTLDLAGNPRTVGARIDLGAFEWQQQE